MKDWTEHHSQQIKEAFGRYEDEPLTLPGLSPHQQQSAKVLIALAETIGGNWPQKARSALLEIFSAYNGSQVSPTQLLSDIRDAFARHGNLERLFSAELLGDLHSLDHRTYYEWTKQGDPMTPHALSLLLRKHFGIYSRSQRRGKEKLRGYQLCDFLEAWDRYLPGPETDSKKAAQADPGSAPIQIGPKPGPTPISPNKIAPCLNVPVQKSTSEISPNDLSKWQQTQAKSIALLKNIAGKAAGIFTNHPS